MYTNTDTIKLFDSNNKFVADFDSQIEQIEISIHGENYYDTDEDLVNTNLIPLDEVYKDEELEKTMDLVDAMVVDNAPAIKIVNEDKHKVKFKDFVPVLFFACIAAVLVVSGYYFLNHVDLSAFLGKFL